MNSASIGTERALVVAHQLKNALRIAAMNDAAARLGLAVGTALADARARHPAIEVAQSDPDADRRLLDAVADWCDRYTPLVALDPPAGIMLDIAGCAHLFGGEAALGRDIVRRLAAQGLRARLAIADTPGGAWAVARYGAGNGPGSQFSPSPLAGEGGEMRSIEPGERGGGDALIERPHPSRTQPSPRRLRNDARLLPLQAGEDGGGGARPLPRGERENIFVIPAGAVRDALAPLPLAALRLPLEAVAAAADVGLSRIGHVLDLPRATLAARFGEVFLRRLDQALGRLDEPIAPRRPAPCYIAEQHFAEPIARERDVLATLARLAIRLGYAMEAQGEGARGLELALFRTDGKVCRIAVGTGAPLREADRISRLFKDKLATVGEACDPGFGYDLVRLSAPLTERCAPTQADLDLAAGRASGAAHDHAELGHLIDRFGARFGLRRVARLVPQDAHIPEFAVAAVPAHAVWTSALPRLLSPFPLAGEGEDRRSEPGEGESRNPLQACLHPSRRRPRLRSDALPPPLAGEGGAQSAAGGGGMAAQDSLAPVRPARLFARPERIQAIAEVPDGPPVRFRWRRVLHEVAAAEGPERIALAWWRDADGRALTRDYFRIETGAGVRLWLYREGLYGREAQPRWFLHGLFG